MWRIHSHADSHACTGTHKRTPRFALCIRSRTHAHRHHCQAASTFPIKPDDLIDRCKGVILAQAGIQDGSIDESIYADDFRFCAPFVGGPTNASPDDPLPGLTKVRARARPRVRVRVRAMGSGNPNPNPNPNTNPNPNPLPGLAKAPNANPNLTLSVTLTLILTKA